MESDIVSGQQSAWVLLKKLGEGDAGEVYLVESLLDKQAAILKRPVRSAFASDVIRQTSQITVEGRILQALSDALKMETDVQVSVPELIDQSGPGTSYSDRLFIVIEKARGFDLSFLARAARLGIMSAAETQAETPEEQRFLKALSESGRVPDRIVLSTLNTLLMLFDKIHYHAFDMEGVEAHGILWNDVKPEHLFWDPWRARLTIIDWGNGQFLEADGATRDRRFSSQEDYRQFIDAMGRFLEDSAPNLLSRLEWPERGTMYGAGSEALELLQGRIWEALQEQVYALVDARAQEVDLIHHGAADEKNGDALETLDAIHRRIIHFGEMPDYAGALTLVLRYARRFVLQDRMDEVQRICEWAIDLPGSEPGHLKLVARLARITARADAQGATEAQHVCLSNAVQTALDRDWAAVLWNLAMALRGSPEPDWWFDLVTTIRRLPLGAAAGDVHPLMIARRILLTLQSSAERMERQSGEINHSSLARLQNLIHHLREEVVPKWVHFDPDPPDSNLTYAEIDDLLEDIGAFLPDAREAIDQALQEPRKQVRRVLADWERGDFIAANAGLRQALLWDPDRKRVLRAEKALEQAPHWLEKVQCGPQPGEHYQAFVMDIEFEGRELRNQVGPAGWLDLILEGCRRLRKGAWPPDLFTELPLLVAELPWLRRYERRERLPATVLEGEPPVLSGPVFAAVSGVIRGRLGPDCDMHITAPLDAWVAEARGSSARVFTGLLRDTQGSTVQAAIKLMRMDKIEYALPLFKEEVIVMNAMRGVPGLTPLYECGFLRIENGSTLPAEREAAIEGDLSGSLIRMGMNSGQEFVNTIESRIEEGWTPYLAIEQRDPKDNLLALCDASMTGGIYRPVSDLLLMSIQICDILIEAHKRNIVYRDHKILHYYWLESTSGVYAIDWNVARLYPEGLSDYEKQMDLVQFGARALHHILTGRTAPGALPLGPTRPEEIEQAAKSYQAQWTYDDQRLPDDVRAVLERVLAGGYNNADQLREDLIQSFLNLPVG